jgi:hypothetical protein
MWSFGAKSHSSQDNSLNHTHCKFIQNWLHFPLDKLSNCLMQGELRIYTHFIVGHGICIF